VVFNRLIAITGVGRGDPVAGGQGLKGRRAFFGFDRDKDQPETAGQKEHAARTGRADWNTMEKTS
jgi:hypothetical protein